MKVYIFIVVYNDVFYPETLYGSLNECTDGIEYVDVVREDYQIWEYPSGKIFSVKSNKKLKGSDEFKVPGKDSWQPVYKLLKTDEKLVSELYEKIKEHPRILKRISMRWRRPWETLFFKRSSLKKFLQ